MRMGSLVALQEEMNRAFRDARAWRASPPARVGFEPPTDIARTDEAYIVRLDLPGVPRDKVSVWAEAGALFIRGQKDPPAEGQGGRVRGERQYGSFSRALALPSDADPDRTSARLRQGVLEVSVGRRRAGRGQRIEVPVE